MKVMVMMATHRMGVLTSGLLRWLITKPSTYLSCWTFSGGSSGRPVDASSNGPLCLHYHMARKSITLDLPCL